MIAAILYGLFVCFIVVLLLLGILLVFSRPWLLWIIIPVIILFVIAIIYGMKKDAPSTQNATPHTGSNSASENAHDISNGKKTINTKLVGVTHLNKNGEEIQDILPELHAGDQLAFIPDIDNPYDENAIAVYCGSSHIGYLNRKLAEDIADHIEWGDRVTGSITEITGGGTINYGCNITLTIH